jgi:hypothetical protein
MPNSSIFVSSSSTDTSVDAPTESAAPDEEQPADHTNGPAWPAPNAPEGSTAPSASVIVLAYSTRPR